MDNTFDLGGDIIWKPSQAQINHARLTEFMQLHQIPDFSTLMEKSTQDIAWFTEAILNFLKIEFYEPFEKVVDLTNGISMPEWCVGGKMNIVHNCLDKYIGTPTQDQTALIWEGEEGGTRKLTYFQLFNRVNQAANALRSLGLGKGDAVGIYMPMTPETVIAFLAVVKIGGIVLPLFSGYGSGAIVTRLKDADAKALFLADGFYRAGKTITMKETADKAAEQIPTLKTMIVFNRVDIQISMTPGRDHWWHEIMPKQPTTAATELTSAEDIMMITYTSGTTGRPKGAVHTHCGFPIKSAQDMAFGTDVHAEDTIYWITDLGWMMGPWLIFGTLILGATFFIYDGTPLYPDAGRLWRMVEQHKINSLGLSPTLVRALIPYGEEPFKNRDLTSLRLAASTGEPWNPTPWIWLYENILEKSRPIVNYSGGTEIGGGIVMGNPILPLKATAFSAPCPGIAADIYDENGSSVTNKIGELVIKAPWIGMTRGFWQDNERYHQTYWARWENTWVHGDWAAKDSDGMWYILGRSDDTIKIAGKRLGPAEVESILVHHPNVIEAGAIGIPHEIKGSELVIFCVLDDDSLKTEAFEKELIDLVIDKIGKALAPKRILFVSDLPKTRNAKVMRRVVRSAYLGEDPGDISSLANPESVKEIQTLK